MSSSLIKSIKSDKSKFFKSSRNQSVTFINNSTMRNRHSTFCFEINHLWYEYVVDFFVDLNLISNVKNEKFKRFDKMIVLNVIANSNIDFWDFANEIKNLCETNDVFSTSHIKLIALNEKCEIFDTMIVSKIIVDSNICFDVAIKISNSCKIDEINESSKTDFFSFLHTDLNVLIEKNKLLMIFFACVTSMFDK